MTATVAFANTSITFHNYHFFFVVGIMKTSSPRKFDVYNNVAVYNHCCRRPPGFLSLVVASLYPQRISLLSCHPPPSPW